MSEQNQSNQENHLPVDSGEMIRTLAETVRPDKKRIYAAIESRIRKENQPIANAKRSSFPYARLAFAASFLLAILGVSYGFFFQNRDITNPFYLFPLGETKIAGAEKGWIEPGELAAEGLTIETMKESLASLIQANRYRVRLDKSTSIHVVDANSIQLQRGSLFAEVDKRSRSSKPFTVLIGDLTVCVMGTQFSVDCLGSEINVSVREGRVQVSSRQGEKIVLSEGESVSFCQEKIGSAHRVSKENVAAWSQPLVKAESNNQQLRQLMRKYFGSRTY